MRLDASRYRTHSPERDYSAVLLEQGRMLMDADLHEEHDILADRIETGTRDAVGRAGAPMDDAGFLIEAAGADLTIGAGHYLVDGILVQNRRVDLPFAEQPYRATDLSSVTGTGHLAIYLDVWRRLVTALDAPSIREVALGGPTTTVREQTVWQVRHAEVPATWTCAQPIPGLEEPTGTMAARAQPEEVTSSPCIIPPGAGFTGLGNQLYRVEVLDGGSAYDLTTAPDVTVVDGIPANTRNQVRVASTAGLASGQAVELYRVGADPQEATFAHIASIDQAVVALTSTIPAFSAAEIPALRVRRVGATVMISENNGSVVARIERIEGSRITVSTLGADEVLGFQPGDWVEIRDDRLEHEGLRGELRRIDAIDKAQHQVLLLTDATQLANPPDGSGIDPARHPKLTKWDAARAITVANPAPNDDWLHLKDGVQIRFAAGTFRTGDFWSFPARTATIDPDSGTIEWPQQTGGPAERLPMGITHHRAPLALVEYGPAGGLAVAFSRLMDCRDLFPPAAALTNLLYVGGDGQEGHPAGGAANVPLPAPLEARVVNGGRPVQGARVEFSVVAPGTGVITTPQPIITDVDGFAACDWSLDTANEHQTVQAQLLDAGGQPVANQVLRYRASLDRAAVEMFPHVEEISWANDRVMRLDEFNEKGLFVVFSEPMLREAASLSSFVVTIEIPDLALLHNEPFFAGHRPFILFGGIEIAADNVWHFRPCPPLPPDLLASWLDQERVGPLGQARKFGCLDGTTFDPRDLDLNPIRVRVTLKGDVILAADGERLLDGDAFGRPDPDGRIGLRLPSGDNVGGGDFESWFFFDRSSI